MEQYSDKNIVTLDDITHIRQRPGMYIGGLGDGRWYIFLDKRGDCQLSKN